MKVSYDFMTDIEDDYEDLKIFQKAIEMYGALIEIKDYLRQLKNVDQTPEIDNIIENIFDIIFDSDIGEI
jgi:hypothetical protein